MDTALNILLVDDEKLILELFQDLLHAMGHSVTGTSNPTDALAAIGREQFDIAFIDQFLGPMLGFDLMERLQRLDPDLSCVLVTGNWSTELVVEAFQRGAVDFIAKPFFEDDVIRSIAYVRKKRDLDRTRCCLMLELEQRVREKTDELMGIGQGTMG